MKVGNGEFYVGDCFDVMRDLPDGSVDMILCDLPYGTTQNKWDTVLPLDKLWAEYWRIAKPNAAIVLTATQPFTSALIASEKRFFKYDLIWQKNKATGFLNAKKQPLRQHEHVLVFYDKQPKYTPQMSTGHRASSWARKTKGSTNYGSQTPTVYESTKERYPVSVLDFPVLNNDSSERLHPTQKPVALFEYLIRTYTNPGDLVLDNTAGSGTTAVAAELSDRRWICIEKEFDYASLAVGRAAEAFAQRLMS